MAVEMVRQQYQTLNTLTMISQFLGFVILLVIVIGFCAYFLRSCLGLDFSANNIEKGTKEKEKEKEKIEKKEIPKKEIPKQKEIIVEKEIPKQKEEAEEIGFEGTMEDEETIEDEENILCLDLKEKEIAKDEEEFILEFEEIDYGELEEYITGQKTGTEDIPAFDESYVKGFNLA